MTRTLGFKLRIRFAGHEKLCGCGTRDRHRYDDMRGWVQALKTTGRFDILEAIVGRGVRLADAYDLRLTPEAILSLSGARDVKPYIERWHEDMQSRRRGAESADKYLRMVRKLIPEGRRLHPCRLTPRDIRRWLRNLDVEDSTRNRHKAALSGFCHFLVDEGVIVRNPVRDVRGFSEGPGRWEYYERDEASALLERIGEPAVAGAVALAIGACFEWQAIQKVRVRDIDLSRHLAFANGGKTPWRRRQCRILVQDAWGRAPLWDFCEPYIETCIQDRSPDAVAFLLPKMNGAVLGQMREAAKAAGLKYLTLHDQRHTHTVGLLRAGYSAMVAAHQLGHSNPSLVWTRYGRFVVDERDYMALRETAPTDSAPLRS